MKIKRVIEIEEKDLERIREIVERENKTALSVTTRGTAYITIADSKPYEERPPVIGCFNCEYGNTIIEEAPCELCIHHSKWRKNE